MADKDIDYSDIAELGKDFFKHATLVLPEPKATVTMRVDRKVLEWFRAQRRGYQTRINLAARVYGSA